MVRADDGHWMPSRRTEGSNPIVRETGNGRNAIHSPEVHRITFAIVNEEAPASDSFSRWGRCWIDPASAADWKNSNSKKFPSHAKRWSNAREWNYVDSQINSPSPLSGVKTCNMQRSSCSREREWCEGLSEGAARKRKAPRWIRNTPNSLAFRNFVPLAHRSSFFGGNRGFLSRARCSFRLPTRG